MKDKLTKTLFMLTAVFLILVSLMFGYYFGFKNGYQSIKFAVDKVGIDEGATTNTNTNNSIKKPDNTADKVYSDKILGVKFSYPTNVNIQKQSKGIALEFSDKKIDDRNSSTFGIKKQRSASASVNIYDSIYAFTGGYSDLKSYISFLGVTVSKDKKTQFGSNLWEEYDELGEGYEHNYVLIKNNKVYNVNVDDLSYEAAKTDLENILKTFEVTD